jgi:hypothetical protein
MTTSLGGYGGMKPSSHGRTGSSDSLRGTGYKQVGLSNFTPEQMQLFQSLFSHAGPDSYLSKLAGGDQSQFEQLEAPALQQFQGLQGQLASRFSGMGLGARRSSGFQNTMNQASSNFAQQLQSQRMGLQRQATMDLAQLSQMLLGQRSYENALLPKEKPLWQQFLLGISPALAQGASQAGSLAGMKYAGLI